MIITSAHIMAEALLRAAALWQGSYDNEAADAALAREQARSHAAHAKGKPYYSGTDYADFYRQSLAGACWLACRQHEDFERPILLLLSSECTGEALDWAMALTNKTCVPVPYEASMWKDVPISWADMPDAPGLPT